jgi:hypothetical protein
MAPSSEAQGTPSSGQAAEKKSSPRWVRYIGTAHIRKITREEWEDAGVRDQDTLAWYVGNGWTVAAAAITDEAMPFIIADELFIVEYDEDVEPSKRVLPEPFNINTIKTDPGIAPEVERSGDGVEQTFSRPLADERSPSGTDTGSNVSTAG